MRPGFAIRRLGTIVDYCLKVLARLLIEFEIFMERFVNENVAGFFMAAVRETVFTLVFRFCPPLFLLRWFVFTAVLVSSATLVVLRDIVVYIRLPRIDLSEPQCECHLFYNYFDGGIREALKTIHQYWSVLKANIKAVILVILERFSMVLIMLFVPIMAHMVSGLYILNGTLHKFAGLDPHCMDYVFRKILDPSKLEVQ